MGNQNLMFNVFGKKKLLFISKIDNAAQDSEFCSQNIHNLKSNLVKIINIARCIANSIG